MGSGPGIARLPSRVRGWLPEQLSAKSHENVFAGQKSLAQCRPLLYLVATGRLLVFAGANRQSLLGRWRLPGAGWLAGISYSLYLSHTIAFHAVQAMFGVSLQGHGAIAFAVYALAVLLLGAALHYLVERSCLHWRDRRKAGDPSAGPVGNSNQIAVFEP